MRYGRCARASPSATSIRATQARANRARRIVTVYPSSLSRRLRLPVQAAGGDGEGDAADQHHGGDRDEGALVAPDDHQQARDQRAQRVAEALQQAVDAVDGVMPVDADLLLAVLGHERA